jgi:hypothetical protein
VCVDEGTVVRSCVWMKVRWLDRVRGEIHVIWCSHVSCIYTAGCVYTYILCVCMYCMCVYKYIYTVYMYVHTPWNTCNDAFRIHREDMCVSIYILYIYIYINKYMHTHT